MDLRVSLLQLDLIWEDAVANKSKIESLLEDTPESDLIILPEMFTTGFSMNAVLLSEPMDGPTIDWMRNLSKEKNAAITGSLIISEEGKYYNRLLWVEPDGSVQTYDKRHLFSMAREHETYTAGSERLIVDWRGWRICPLVCYDLRFPVYSRNTSAYDLLIYVANWPAIRSYAWRTLLHARAIENQAYSIGVNRVGQDGNGYPYSGDSGIYAPGPRSCVLSLSHQESVQTLSLEREYLTDIRQKMPFLADRDHFDLR